MLGRPLWMVVLESPRAATPPVAVRQRMERLAALVVCGLGPSQGCRDLGLGAALHPPFPEGGDGMRPPVPILQGAAALCHLYHSCEVVAIGRKQDKAFLHHFRDLRGVAATACPHPLSLRALQGSRAGSALTPLQNPHQPSFRWVLVTAWLWGCQGWGEMRGAPWGPCCSCFLGPTFPHPCDLSSSPGRFISKKENFLCLFVCLSCLLSLISNKTIIF